MSDKRSLKIDIDYKLPPRKENEQDRTEGAELTANYIEAAVTSSHPQGLEGQQRRIWGRIQRKIDSGIENKSESIELEQAESDFLRKAFENCKVPVAIAKYFVVLEDLIEEVTKRVQEPPTT